MKKRILLLPLIILLCLAVKPASAQRIIGGISLGTNLTQVDGDQFYGFNKFGLNVGPMVALPFGKKRNWSVSMELLYSQKGSYHKGSTDSTYYKLKLDYIDIPVLVHFTDKKIVSAGVGFCYGQLINKVESDLYIVKPNTDFLPYDVSVLGEVALRLWNRLWINVRYQYSMVNLRTVTFTDPYKGGTDNTWERDQYNNVLTFRLTYFFNGEIPGKQKKPKGEEEQ